METIYIERGGHLYKCQIIAKIPQKTCARCGTTFYLQDGRAETGQRRTRGVRYCSSRCARAQAQSEYRARKRVKADLGP